MVDFHCILFLFTQIHLLVISLSFSLNGWIFFLYFIWLVLIRQVKFTELHAQFHSLNIKKFNIFMSVGWFMWLLACPVCNTLTYPHQFSGNRNCIFCIAFFSIKWILCFLKQNVLIKDIKLFVYSAMILWLNLSSDTLQWKENCLSLT